MQSAEIVPFEYATLALENMISGYAGTRTGFTVSVLGAFKALRKESKCELQGRIVLIKESLETKLIGKGIGVAQGPAPSSLHEKALGPIQQGNEISPAPDFIVFYCLVEDVAGEIASLSFWITLYADYLKCGVFNNRIDGRTVLVSICG